MKRGSTFRCLPHRLRPRSLSFETGSSPRVRGMRRRRWPSLAPRRIIPACAGNANPVGSPRARCSDHPRVCGECLVPLGADLWTVGSSPRVRGMRLISPYRTVWRGIIPACAGNAAQLGSSGDGIGDHPRVCGECIRIHKGQAGDNGSSPRVRGMRRCQRTNQAWSGIIPACAGNAWPCSVSRRPRWDHPRVCGECVSTLVDCDWKSGSSPRVRGMRWRLRAHRAGIRIIPACAGNASAPSR